MGERKEWRRPPEDSAALDSWLAGPGGPIRKATSRGFERGRIQWKDADAEWLQRMRRNWWKEENQPGDSAMTVRLRALRDRLLEFGGHSVCMPWKEPDLQKIETRGQLWYGVNALMRKGEMGQCHSNSAMLWNDLPAGLRSGTLVIATGYALSRDGMWRQHSWCLLRQRSTTRVVETTMPREAYFGFAMTGHEATGFYLAQVIEAANF